MASVSVEKLYSFENYLTYDDGTDTHFELMNGQLEPMNPPTFRHLLIAKFVEQQLDAEIERLAQPWLCLREAGIRTGWQKSRLTDVYVIAAVQVSDTAAFNRIEDTQCYSDRLANLTLEIRSLRTGFNDTAKRCMSLPEVQIAVQKYLDANA